MYAGSSLWLFSSVLGSVVGGLWSSPTTLSRENQVINAQPFAAYLLDPMAHKHHRMQRVVFCIVTPELAQCLHMVVLSVC